MVYSILFSAILIDTERCTIAVIFPIVRDITSSRPLDEDPAHTAAYTTPQLPILLNILPRSCADSCIYSPATAHTAVYTPSQLPILLYILPRSCPCCCIYSSAAAHTAVFTPPQLPRQVYILPRSCPYSCIYYVAAVHAAFI